MGLIAVLEEKGRQVSGRKMGVSLGIYMSWLSLSHRHSSHHPMAGRRDPLKGNPLSCTNVGNIGTAQPMIYYVLVRD